MTLLEAEPTAAPPGPPQGERAPGTPAGAPAAGACERCSAPMEPTQDWCLECGTAAPGRLGGTPGWRAASTVVGLTLLLVLGAVAASYAALTGEATQVASRPPAPSAAPAAQAPPAVPAAPAPTPTTEAPAPEVEAPAGAGSDAVDPVEVDPTPSPSPSPSATPVPTTPPGSGSTDGSDDEATPAGPERIAVPADAGSLYDPYGKAEETNEPARALDGDPGTSWLGRAADEAETMGFGYVVDLDDPAEVREVQLGTKTPGFRVEVYGATTKALPPDVLDERWTRLRTRSDVDAAVGGAPKDGNRNGDGEERIVLGKRARGEELRHLLLWFTLVPENGPTIRLTEVELRG